MRRRALEAQRLEASSALQQLQSALEKEQHWRRELQEAIPLRRTMNVM